MKKAWWKESVVYQIYPRSFMDSNGDGIGDIKGITSKLPYLQELGIDVIWLSPVYESPNDDNGYDISDYRNIMKEFGTMAEFDQMIETAHSLGIKLVMDLVVNHTSDEHKWFVESKKSKDNPYRDYYVWKEGKEDGSEPNNWGSFFSGSVWEFDENTGMYYLHLFTKKQPDLNWDNPVVRNEVYDMMNWWCEKGVDGFRMDVISLISKTTEQPDGVVYGSNLYGDGSPYYNHGPNVHTYLKEMNKKVLSKYDLITVGETPAVSVEEAAKYAGEDSNELSMVFQFEHVDIGSKENKWNTDKVPLVELKAIMSKWQVGLHEKAWNSLYLANHDQPRSVSRFANDSEEYRERSAKMLATSLHMMQGTPYIYQGEELGMVNYPFTKMEQFRDVETLNAYKELVEVGKTREPEELIRCFQYKGRDNARTPMQWDATKHAGFTTGTPWIEVHPNYLKVNAEVERKDSNSVFSYYKKLIALRKQYDIMVYGSYELLLPNSESIFAYTRTMESERLLVLCNFTEEEQPIEILEEFQGGANQVLISNYGVETVGTKRTLDAYEAIVIYHI
ncbi:MAG: alpha-glucosidase [Eubacteriales bacterium]